jgi:hypothetical protein
MRLNGDCTQKNSGSPWVPGCPTDLSSTAAEFQYRVGTGDPSMAADRTTEGEKSPRREKAGDAPWRGQTGNPFARSRCAISCLVDKLWLSQSPKASFSLYCNVEFFTSTSNEMPTDDRA